MKYSTLQDVKRAAEAGDRARHVPDQGRDRSGSHNTPGSAD
jgi:hypothetical protein